MERDRQGFDLFAGSYGQRGSIIEQRGAPSEAACFRKVFSGSEFFRARFGFNIAPSDACAAPQQWRSKIN